MVCHLCIVDWNQKKRELDSIEKRFIDEHMTSSDTQQKCTDIKIGKNSSDKLKGKKEQNKLNKKKTHFELTSESVKLAELQLFRPESARVTGL